MTDHNTNEHGVDKHLVDAEHQKSTVDELVIHGLIESWTRDNPETQSRRIAAAMDSIRTPAPIRLTDRLRQFRFVAVAASLVLAVGLLSILFSNTSQSANALVSSSIEKAADAGPRRYTLMVAAEPNTQPIEVGTLDLAPVDQMLLQTTTPDGGRMVVGRNETGEWAIRRDGAVDRAEPRRAWPSWLHLADDALIGSPEEVLKVLAHEYTLTTLDAESIAGRPQRVVLGTANTGGPSRRPTEVAVYLDAQSLMVTRMELRWNAAAIQAAKERSQRRAGPDEIDGGDRPPREGPRRPFPGQFDGAEGGPDGMPPMGGPPRGDRPPPPGGRPPARGSALPQSSPQVGPQGDRPAPPAVLRFEVMRVEPFAHDWFDAATHE